MLPGEGKPPILSGKIPVLQSMPYNAGSLGNEIGLSKQPAHNGQWNDLGDQIGTLGAIV